MGEVIAVISGKGGTGKTSTCAGVAIALAQKGERVLCIDCDVGLRNLDISLGMSEVAALSFQEVCRGSYGLSLAAVHPHYPTLHFLTAPLNCLPGEIDADAFAEMILQARRDYDFVFLDAPAGTDLMFRLTSCNADRCVLVTGSDPASIRDAGRTGQLLELMGKTNVRLIVNRIQPKMVAAMALTVDDVMDQAGLPLLGIIPEDPNVTFAAAFGKNAALYAKKTAAVAAYDRIAARIQGMPVSIPIRTFR